MSRAAAFRFLCGCLSGDLAGSQDALARSAHNPAFVWETFVQIAAEMLVAPAMLDALRGKNPVAALPGDVIEFFEGVATRGRCERETCANRHGASRQIDREPFEVTKRAISQRRLVCSAQNDARRMMGLERFLPALRAQAPAVTGLQSGKADLWNRR